MIKKLLLIIVIFLGAITFAQSETSWIKKKDKTEKVDKVKKVEKKSSSWIKKKEVKENKKKLKEKVKESKSWITKKSKEKVKDIKEKLKKHESLAQLPKAELYFAISIDPSENEDARYIYGYINSDKKSENSKRFKFKNKVFYSNSDGIAFFDDNKTTCQIDVLKDEVFGELKGKAIIKCKSEEILAADINFENNGKTGKGYNIVFKGGLSGVMEFFDTKTKTIAKLENYKIEETQLVERKLPTRSNKKIFLKPNGKYYALLIGNSKYSNGWDNLVSPTNDIREIKKVLDKSYKFEKILMVENATKKEIYQSFQKLAELTTSNDFVFIYFSGHGKTRAEQAYWIPTDGSKKWGNGDWINTNEVTIFLREEIKAHHLALLVDSCYVGGAFKGAFIIDEMTEEETRMVGEQAKEALNLRERVVIASGDNNRVEDTVGNTNHSRFALAFIGALKAFNQKEMPLNMNSIKFNLDLAYQGILNQKPQMYSPATWGPSDGEFIFIPKKILK
tara:strand:- start:4117 stop:5631 length:1515 start_codon:yes stop_codon:yes gene_type:complete